MSLVVSGEVNPRFDSVRDAFVAAFEGKPDMGAALAIRVDGQEVVNLWGGLADSDTGTPWGEDTLSVIFSCTKGLSSIMAAQLVQSGDLSYQDKVSKYWPEFAAKGKQDVTVAQILSHRSGLSALRDPLSTAEMLDWDFVTQRLAGQKPLWTPGQGYAYYAITHGWLIGEVIRRITGLRVGEYFQQRIAGPVAAEAWIGLPAALNSRVANMQVGPTLRQLVDDQAANRSAELADWLDRAMTLGGALMPELVGPDAGFNNALVQQAEIPGAGGIATASALAAIWSATITTTNGSRLLSDESVRLGTEVQSQGSPVWAVPGPWPRWGMGFQLDSDSRRYLGSTGFGHDGAGGQVAFADPEFGVGFAFITNQMEAIEDFRATKIVDALRQALTR